MYTPCAGTIKAIIQAASIKLQMVILNFCELNTVLQPVCNFKKQPLFISKKMRTSIIAVCVVLLLLPGSVFAQYPPFTKWYQNPLGFKPLNLHTANGIIIPAVAAGLVLLFSKNDSGMFNKTDLYSDVGVSYGYYGSKTTVYQHNIGVLFNARKFMALGAELSTVHVTDKVNNTWGIGIRPFVRFYPVNREHFKLFFQSGAGLMLFAENFPKPSGFFGDNREGTRLNGNPKYGIGTVFNISRHWSVQAALWHIHFSNGNNPGYERNPGHDSNGFSFGLMYHSHNRSAKK